MSTATTNITRHLPTEVPLRGIVITLVLWFAGLALCLASFGLWMVPNTADLPGLSLMKLGASVFMLICGLCFLSLARR